MKMNKPLEAGQWCKPKDEKEWKAVLDLAEVLGIYTRGTRATYDSCVTVWAVDGGTVNECIPCHDGTPLSAPDFISGMYALAEKKGERATELPRGPRGQKPDMTQERLHALEVKSALFDDILKRLTVLEGVSDKKEKMTFLEAMHALIRGKAVTNELDPLGDVLRQENGFIQPPHRHYIINQKDILSNRWKVVE